MAQFGNFLSIIIPLALVLYAERYVPIVTDTAIHEPLYFYAGVLLLALISAWLNWMIGGRWVALYSAHARLKTKVDPATINKFQSEYKSGESVVVRSYGRGESDYRYKIFTDDSRKLIKVSKVFRTK